MKEESRKPYPGENEMIRKCIKMVVTQLGEFYKKDISIDNAASVMVSTLSSIISSAFSNNNPFLFVLEHSKTGNREQDINELVKIVLSTFERDLKHTLKIRLGDVDESKVVH